MVSNAKMFPFDDVIMYFTFLYSYTTLRMLLMFFPDFINVDECTDDAIADSQLTDCDELAEKRFESDITDACGWVIIHA